MFWGEKSHNLEIVLPNGFKLQYVDDWRPFIHQKFDNIFEEKTSLIMGQISLDFNTSSHTLGANPCVAGAFLFSDKLKAAGVLHSRGNELPVDFINLARQGVIVGGIVGGSKETYMRNKRFFQDLRMTYITPRDERKDFAVMAESSSLTIYYSYEDVSLDDPNRHQIEV